MTMTAITKLSARWNHAVLAARGVRRRVILRIRLTNGEITATVYLPDAKNGFYTTTRFDWSGAIGSLKYKGHDYYGIWWSKITDIYDFGYEGPSKDVISADFTAMVGPAEEFGALGYNDVPAGGLFVKPGVGVLEARRDELQPFASLRDCQWREVGRQDLARRGGVHAHAERAVDQFRLRLHEGRPADARQAADDDLARHEEHGLEAHRDERLQPQLHDHRQAATPGPTSRSPCRGR